MSVSLHLPPSSRLFSSWPLSLPVSTSVCLPPLYPPFYLSASSSRSMIKNAFLTRPPPAPFPFSCFSSLHRYRVPYRLVPVAAADPSPTVQPPPTYKPLPAPDREATSRAVRLHRRHPPQHRQREPRTPATAVGVHRETRRRGRTLLIVSGGPPRRVRRCRCRRRGLGAPGTGRRGGAPGADSADAAVPEVRLWAACDWVARLDGIHRRLSLSLLVLCCCCCCCCVAVSVATIIVSHRSCLQKQLSVCSELELWARFFVFRFLRRCCECCAQYKS